MSDTFLTINAISEGIYKEKGSKFIALAYPVHTVDRVKEITKELRKEYYDARHWCFAYILGQDKSVYRANDDGEPSGSAGLPILGQIRSKNLTNVLVVVVRYFGGTKLGVSGLVNAYKTATLEALQHAQIVEQIIKTKIVLAFSYVNMNDVMKLVKNYQLEIIKQNYTNNHCEMELFIREKLVDEIIHKFLNIPELRLNKEC